VSHRLSICASSSAIATNSAMRSRNAGVRRRREMLPASPGPLNVDVMVNKTLASINLSNLTAEQLDVLETVFGKQLSISGDIIRIERHIVRSGARERIAEEIENALPAHGGPAQRHHGDQRAPGDGGCALYRQAPQEGSA
jgi:hypothetical protein